MDPSDRQLAERAQGGDEEAFADLVRRFAPRLYRFFVANGLRTVDADDLVQESFIRAHRAIARYDSSWAFSTWLYTIGRRLAANHRRDRRQTVTLVDGMDTPMPMPADPDPQGIWHLAREHLSPPHYESLWLYYGEGLTVKEIGEVMGCTTVNVKVRLHRGRQQMAEILRQEAPGLCPALAEVPMGGDA